jgi:hypothetical protein
VFDDANYTCGVPPLQPPPPPPRWPGSKFRQNHMPHVCEFGPAVCMPVSVWRAVGIFRSFFAVVLVARLRVVLSFFAVVSFVVRGKRLYACPFFVQTLLCMSCLFSTFLTGSIVTTWTSRVESLSVSLPHLKILVVLLSFLANGLHGDFRHVRQLTSFHLH